MTPIEQIRDRINIVDLIKEHIDIKPSGSNFKALCPFHEEKTPSFMVSSSKQLFKCFGCGKGGDIFTFIEEYERVEFKEALRILADKAHVSLPRHDARLYTRKNVLLDVMSLAADFYYAVLVRSARADHARDYLAKRHINDVTADYFKLGFSLDAGNELLSFFRKKTINEEHLIAVGLVNRNERGLYDVFRGRIMFPIMEEHGKVIGFGARIVDNHSESPKYINTRQTELYDKSRILYGLDKAKESIRKNDLVVLVEGYMDVIASHTAGVTNVVSASGTALTEIQLQLLKRFTNNIAFAYDMDKAGIGAALRSYSFASSHRMNTKIVQLPEGLDPDDVIRQNKNVWLEAIAHSVHILDYYFKIVLSNLNPSALSDKKKARDALVPIIFSVDDPLERTYYLDKLAEWLQVGIEDVTHGVKRGDYAINSTEFKKEEFRMSRRDYHDELVLRILALVFVHLEIVSLKAKLPALELDHVGINHLYKEVSRAYNEGTISRSDLAALQAGYDREITELILLADKDYAELDVREIEREFIRLTDHLNQYTAKMERETYIKQIKEAEENQDEEKIVSLTKKLDGLTK